MQNKRKRVADSSQEDKAQETTTTTTSTTKKTKTTIDEPQEKDYSKMLVTELREELKGRGLDHKGKKADLIKRLEEADNPIDFWGMFVSFVKLISFFR